eukprot:2862726-Amphidinium_carterae.1
MQTDQAGGSRKVQVQSSRGVVIMSTWNHHPVPCLTTKWLLLKRSKLHQSSSNVEVHAQV